MLAFWLGATIGIAFGFWLGWSLCLRDVGNTYSPHDAGVECLMLLARKMARIPDGVERMAFVFDIFGREAVRMKRYLDWLNTVNVPTE